MRYRLSGERTAVGRPVAPSGANASAASRTVPGTLYTVSPAVNGGSANGGRGVPDGDGAAAGGPADERAGDGAAAGGCAASQPPPAPAAPAHNTITTSAAILRILAT